MITSTGAIGGFAHREAIRVIADTHRAPQAGFQILLQRTAIQCLGIGIADQAGNWAQAARNANAKAALGAKPRFGFRH
jgi:nitrate/nitrite transporter NarK